MITKSLLIFTILLNISISAWAQKSRPNVIVVLADDIGLGDLSHYRKMSQGKVILETPNLDKIAASGMVFTDAHAPAALCAPSRYAIITGNSCYRSPFPWGVWGAYEQSPIKEDQLTLGRLMQQAGYQTAFLGKWHLGGDYQRKSNPNEIYRGPRYKPETDVDITKIVGSGPEQLGFDYSLTFPAGIQDVPYAVYENSQWMPLASDSKIDFVSKENMLKQGVKLDKMEGMGDTNWHPKDMGPLLVNKATAYIDQHAKDKKPFFMYYCSQAVHLPHNPPEELNGIKIANTTPTRHMDMIKELDVQMGMLIDKLKEAGIYENTLFIFTSDNGGLTRKETMASGHRPSDIYRGGKNTPFEGGHRVPFIAAWPKKIKAGSINMNPVLGLDIMATLAALTKQDIADGQAMDSYNLLPSFLEKKQAEEHPFILVQGGTGKEVIIIEEGWKLIIQVDKKDKTDQKRTPRELYNLKDNPSEQSQFNLIDDPDQQERIEKLFKKYNDTRNSAVQLR